MAAVPLPPGDDSLDLDGLLGLDGDEFFPVDTFFGDYVDELTSRSKRHAELTLQAPCTTAKHVRLGVAPAAGAAAAAPMPAHLLGLAPGGMLPPQGGVPIAMPSALGLAGVPIPQATLPSEPAGLSALQLPVMPTTIAGLPAVPGGAAGQPGLPGLSPAAAGLAGMPVALAGAAVPAAPLPLQHQQQTEASVSTQQQRASGGSAGERLTGRHKTFKQQEANKLAQQRYRRGPTRGVERKKAKFHELEETATQTRNALLESMNNELQSQLVEKEREVDKLRQVLDTETASGSYNETTGTGGGGGGPGEEEESAPAPSPSSRSQSSLAAAAAAADVVAVPCSAALAPPGGEGPPESSGEFKVRFEEQIAALRAHMVRRQLLGADPQGTGVPVELVAEVAELVGRCCQMCQAALRSKGPQVLELMARDPTTLADAMALMLPQGGSTPEVQISSIGSRGYLPSAKVSAQLGECLDRIKDNLRREQRAVLELNCCVVSRILKPLQAAHYMLGVFPHHCDALALSNVLARESALAGRAGANGASAPPAGGAPMAVAI
eukprot:scaffold28.g7571.t1